MMRTSLSRFSYRRLMSVFPIQNYGLATRININMASWRLRAVWNESNHRMRRNLRKSIG
jgi:hypothetical protein